MDFCDPQGGKGAADRMAATAKNHIRIFINEGNDVTTAQQMKDALLSHGGVKGVRVAAADHLEEISIEQPKIQGTEANIIPTYTCSQLYEGFSYQADKSYTVYGNRINFICGIGFRDIFN